MNNHVWIIVLIIVGGVWYTLSRITITLTARDPRGQMDIVRSEQAGLVLHRDAYTFEVLECPCRSALIFLHDRDPCVT
jgi:hypothetical protein